MVNVTLKSSSLINTTGFIDAMRNDYKIGGKYAEQAIDIVARGWFEHDLEKAEYVLANPDQCKIVNETELYVTGLPGGD